jgi:hypothetical protein
MKSRADRERRRQYDEEIEEQRAFFQRPNSMPSAGFERAGADRPYITIHPCFAPILTERQKTASGRRYRQRGAAAWGRMRDILKRTNMTVQEFVEQLDDEELVRGQLRDTDGKFRGRRPAWVPNEFHRACIRELLRRGQTLWRENYLQAIQVLTDIAQDDKQKAADRLKAAMHVIERIEGKIPDKIEVSLDAPWEGIIMDIVAEVSDEQLENGRRRLSGGGRMVIDGDINEPEPSSPVPQPSPRRHGRASRRR